MPPNEGINGAKKGITVGAYLATAIVNAISGILNANFQYA